MKSTRHFTLFALQANDAHSYIAEKRSRPLSCNPTFPSILWFSLRSLLIRLFLFHLSPFFPHLFSFYSISEAQMVLLHLGRFFFSPSWIHFLRQTLSIFLGNRQLPNSRWHLKYTSAPFPVSYCFSCSFTRCGNTMWLSITPRATRERMHFTFTYIRTKKQHKSNRSSSIRHRWPAAA